MENNKDLILQALYYNVNIIKPTYNGKLYLKFPEIGYKKMFLERIMKLGIGHKLIYNYDLVSDLTIEVI